MAFLKEVNLKYDMPTADLAVRRATWAIQNARTTGAGALKLIHGRALAREGGAQRGGDAGAVKGGDLRNGARRKAGGQGAPHGQGDAAALFKLRERGPVQLGGGQQGYELRALRALAQTLREDGDGAPVARGRRPCHPPAPRAGPGAAGGYPAAPAPPPQQRRGGGVFTPHPPPPPHPTHPRPPVGPPQT